MVELRTRILGLIAPMLLLSCAGMTLAQQEDGPATIGNVTAVLHATRSNNEHTAPAEKNPRHRIRRDEMLLPSFPLWPELNEQVIMGPNGFTARQSAECQKKTATKMIPAICRLFAARHTVARELLGGSAGSLETSERINFWRTTGLRNGTSDSILFSRSSWRPTCPIDLLDRLHRSIRCAVQLRCV
jgi:hypothetical protein